MLLTANAVGLTEAFWAGAKALAVARQANKARADRTIIIIRREREKCNRCNDDVAMKKRTRLFWGLSQLKAIQRYLVVFLHGTDVKARLKADPFLQNLP
jgi:hypothetical protein